MKRELFLSVYTPTYARPKLLKQCKESVAAQTATVQHVTVEDRVGLGMDGMFGAIQNHAYKMRGDLCMVLSDDNVFADENAARDLLEYWDTHGRPDVVVFKGDIVGTIQPLSWGGEPKLNEIDLSNFAVTRALWRRHAPDWGRRYEGDFDFIHTLWEHEYRFSWWDRLMYRALQISQGKSEREMAA